MFSALDNLKFFIASKKAKGLNYIYLQKLSITHFKFV